MRKDEVDDFVTYVEADRDALVRFARVVCKGDPALAEDVVQSALVKLYPRWSKVVRSDSPHGYVRRIITNEYATVARRHSFRRERTHEDPVELAAPADVTTDGDSDRVADRDLVRQALAAITPPPAKRAAVYLRYVEDRTDAEIGAMLGYAPGTVKNPITQGKKEMLVYLEDAS